MTADETTPDEAGRAVLGAEERERWRRVADEVMEHFRAAETSDISDTYIALVVAEVYRRRQSLQPAALLDAADERDRFAELGLRQAEENARLVRERDRLAAEVERLREAARYSVQASIHVDRPTEVRIEREGVVLVDGMMADGLDATLVRRLTSERDAARAESAALRETVERLRTEVETPSAAVTQLQQAVHRRTEQRDAARAEAQAMREAVERVRALHRPVDVEPSATICAACSTARGSGESLRYFPFEEWPCETMLALDPVVADTEGGDGRG